MDNVELVVTFMVLLSLEMAVPPTLMSAFDAQNMSARSVCSRVVSTDSVALVIVNLLKSLWNNVPVPWRLKIEDCRIVPVAFLLKYMLPPELVICALLKKSLSELSVNVQSLSNTLNCPPVNVNLA